MPDMSKKDVEEYRRAYGVNSEFFRKPPEFGKKKTSQKGKKERDREIAENLLRKHFS